MKRPPYRSDKQYKEIEKFRDYELTQCIAYEMAIRNAENIKLAEEYNAPKSLDRKIPQDLSTR